MNMFEKISKILVRFCFFFLIRIFLIITDFFIFFTNTFVFVFKKIDEIKKNLKEHLMWSIIFSFLIEICFSLQLFDILKISMSEIDRNVDKCINILFSKINRIRIIIIIIKYFNFYYYYHFLHSNEIVFLALTY